MNLKQLIRQASAGHISELELLSLEGGIYLLRARTPAGFQTLLDERGRPMHLRSATHMRELLQGLPASAPELRCVLVQQVVHDEMCGARQGPIEPLRVPLSLTSAW